MAMTKKKLTEIAKRYKEITAEQNKLKAEKEQLRDLLIKEMGERQLTEYLVDVYKISYSCYESTAFDKEHFAEDHPRLLQKYSYIQTKQALNVK